MSIYKQHFLLRNNHENKIKSWSHLFSPDERKFQKRKLGMIEDEFFVGERGRWLQLHACMGVQVYANSLCLKSPTRTNSCTSLHSDEEEGRRQEFWAKALHANIAPCITQHLLSFSLQINDVSQPQLSLHKTHALRLLSRDTDVRFYYFFLSSSDDALGVHFLFLYSVHRTMHPGYIVPKNCR